MAFQRQSLFAILCYAGFITVARAHFKVYFLKSSSDLMRDRQKMHIIRQVGEGLNFMLYFIQKLCTSKHKRATMQSLRKFHLPFLVFAVHSVPLLRKIQGLEQNLDAYYWSPMQPTCPRWNVKMALWLYCLLCTLT